MLKIDEVRTCAHDRNLPRHHAELIRHIKSSAPIGLAKYIGTIHTIGLSPLMTLRDPCWTLDCRDLVRHLCVVVTLASMMCATGCYAPLKSHGIPAAVLPDSFRMPSRTAGPPLNFASLTTLPPRDYLMGADDILEITVPGLTDEVDPTQRRFLVMANGEIHLPQVGAVNVNGMNLVEAQQEITRACANGFIVDPKVNVVLAQKSITNVVVLGSVKQPGTYPLTKYENDVGHALAAAQGLAEDAADVIEVHRRVVPKDTSPAVRVSRLPSLPGEANLPCPCFSHQNDGDVARNVLQISLRGNSAQRLRAEDVALQAGDVIVVPSRRHEVFFVVGQLNRNNTARFTIGDRERELGIGFILPRDREIDVVTAVAMAGYIDPIDSPTTVTVHRRLPKSQPMLIHVDLIKARYDPRETVLVMPGDIIYLNPDAPWWFRRTFDRIITDLILLPYARATDLWIR